MKKQTYPAQVEYAESINYAITKAVQDGGCEVVIQNATDRRTIIQNARLHAVLGDISRQLKWDGSLRDINYWKRLMTIGWMTELNERPAMASNPYNGELIVFWPHTSKMSTKKLAELTEWATAFGTQQDVIWSNDGR
jgi:hypothetical protein